MKSNKLHLFPDLKTALHEISTDNWRIWRTFSAKMFTIFYIIWEFVKLNFDKFVKLV